jgi:8-oxo-dGTP pyrophosphatase MutT (NUDIX family)
MPAAAALHKRDTRAPDARVKRPSAAKAAAFALAAVRETYEETGLMLGVPAAGR